MLHNIVEFSRSNFIVAVHALHILEALIQIFSGFSRILGIGWGKFQKLMQFFLAERPLFLSIKQGKDLNSG